jgi:putative ABC transport system substrate-binding protein
MEAKNDPELDAAFKSIVDKSIPALLVPADAFFAAAREKLADLAASNRVPAIYSLKESVISGGLMSYGNDLPDTYRLIGTYAARIVKGAKPADLPVLQPTKFEFVLNRKAAKALDLSIPPVCCPSSMRSSNNCSTHVRYCPKRTSLIAPHMSALGGIADITPCTAAHVRF